MANWLISRSQLEYQNPLEASRGKKNKLPTLIDFDSPQEEASWIADSILEHHEDGKKLNEFMILIRSAYDGRSIESELIQRDIPYKFIGGTSLLKSAHVRDVLSLLRIAHNSKDDLAWIRYMQLWDGIGVKKAQRISSIMFNTTKEEAIAESESIIGKEHKALKTYLEILKVFSDPKKCINAAIMKLTPLLEDRYDWIWSFLDENVTDHDSISCQHEAKALSDEYGIKYIYGLELSVTFSHPEYNKSKPV